MVCLDNPADKRIKKRIVESLTAIQKETLEYIKKNLRVKPPTFEQMRKAFGVKSNQSIIDRLKRLQQKGLIDQNYLPVK